MKKLLKKVKLIKSKDYLFLLKNININTKLSKKILYFNFKSELLYKYLYFVKKNDKLYIFNSDVKTRFFLPEGLVLFYSLDEDGIYIFKNEKYYNVIIRQNNILVNDFVLFKIDESIKNSLKFEYSLSVNSLDYYKSLAKGYDKFDLRDLSYLWDLSFDTKKLKELFFDFAKPFLISTILALGGVFLYKNYLNHKYGTLQTQYDVLSKKSLIIRKELKEINNNISKWKAISEKIKKLQSFEVLNNLAGIIKGNGRLSYFKIENNELLFTVDASNSTNILKQLSRKKLFNNVVLKSEILLRNGKKRFRFQGLINE